MRTPQEIIDVASKRYNRITQTTGILSRQDVLDFIEQIPPETDKKSAITDWLETISFLTPLDKSRTLDDLPSYGV